MIQVKEITTPESQDVLLIRGSLQGDAKAFRVLVNRYLPLVYNYSYRLSGSAEIAEEVSQEVFVKVYQHLKRFDQSKPLKPWLLRITSNATISILRKQSRVVSLNTSLDALVDEGKEPTIIEEHQAEMRVSNEQLFSAMAKIDPKYRQALLLRYSEEQTYEEIAETMNIPLNTVRTWLRRGRDKLYALVKEIS